MTNEKLVELIQDGQKEYIPQLWDQVYKFIYLMAKRRLIGEERHIKQLEDDLVNEAYFDFLQAVEDYKPNQEASFIHYLSYHLKNGFNRALDIRTSRTRNDPLHHAVSLDAPIGEAEDLTLQDIVIDHISEEDYRLVENADFWQDVHELLERAIFAETDGTSQEILLTMLHKNCTFPQACTILNIPYENQRAARWKYGNGIYHVRRYLRTKALKECREIGIYDYIGYRGCGIGAFRRHCFTSSTERAAIFLADKEAWSKTVARMFS